MIKMVKEIKRYKASGSDKCYATAAEARRAEKSQIQNTVIDKAVLSYLKKNGASTNIVIMDGMRELKPSHIMASLYRLRIDAKICVNITEYYDDEYYVP